MRPIFITHHHLDHFADCGTLIARIFHEISWPTFRANSARPRRVHPGCHESVVAQYSLPRRRIDPIRKQRARNLVTRPRLIERHIGMDSERERLVFAMDVTGRWWTK
jgi:hypothetical protein